MVMSYFKYQNGLPDKKTPKVSLVLAATFDEAKWASKRMGELSPGWLEMRTILKSEQGVYRRMSMWYEYEGLILYMQSFIAQEKEKLTSEQIVSINGRYLLSDEHPAAVLDDMTEAKLSIEEEEEDGNHRQLNKKSIIRAITAHRWLHKMGFPYCDIQKGIFINGPERPNVIDSGKLFEKTFLQLQSRALEYDKDGINILKLPLPNNRLFLIPWTHDESKFRTKKHQRSACHNEKAGQNYLHEKSRGRGIILSDCLFPNGHVSVPEYITEIEMQ